MDTIDKIQERLIKENIRIRATPEEFLINRQGTTDSRLLAYYHQKKTKTKKNMISDVRRQELQLLTTMLEPGTSTDSSHGTVKCWQHQMF